MTLFEVAFSIPGLFAIALFGPLALMILTKLVQDIIEWTTDTIGSFETSNSIQSPPNDQVAMSIQDTEALAFISNHPAMRFHRKA